MKVSVIGAGNVGATCADVLAYREIANEIVLIDIKVEQVAMGNDPRGTPKVLTRRDRRAQRILKRPISGQFLQNAIPRVSVLLGQ